MPGSSVRFFARKQSFGLKMIKQALQNNHDLAYGLGKRTGVLFRTVDQLNQHNAFIENHAVKELNMINLSRDMLRLDLRDVRTYLSEASIEDATSITPIFCGQRVLNDILRTIHRSHVLQPEVKSLIESLMASMPPSFPDQVQPIFVPEELPKPSCYLDIIAHEDMMRQVLPPTSESHNKHYLAMTQRCLDEHVMVLKLDGFGPESENKLLSDHDEKTALKDVEASLSHGVSLAALATDTLTQKQSPRFN